MDPLRQGTHVGEARILRVLGSGSVATVYEVLYRGARRALKVVEGTLVGEPSKVRARLAQEGEAIAMIEHVHVVRWYASGVDDERVWILLELVEGRNLRELVVAEGGRLPVERAVSLARHACEGLAAVHKKGIVHRDVKPENILVTSDDLAKIADFGSAKLPGWGVRTTSPGRLTSSLYTAPETWLDAVQDPRADVYAMGLLLYEAIAGVHPVVSPSADARTMCERHLHYEPPPLAWMADVPGDLSDLVQRATTKDPARRCTARELADGLDVVLDRLLVRRRAEARSVPLPNTELGLQPTIPMAAHPGSGSRDAVVSGMAAAAGAADSELVRFGPRGTIPMPAPAPGGAAAGAARADVPAFELREANGGGDRAASPPRAPAPASVPATLRTPSRPAPVVPAAGAAEVDAARRSTGVPVESAARVRGATAWWKWAVAAGGVLAGLGLWTLFAGEPAPAPRAASVPAGAPVVVSAAVSAAPSAPVPRPAASATAARRAPRAVPSAPRR